MDGITNSLYMGLSKLLEIVKENSLACCSLHGRKQSVLKETNSEYSLEALLLKLELQYFGHLMRRTDSLEKTTEAGKD